MTINRPRNAINSAFFSGGFYAKKVVENGEKWYNETSRKTKEMYQ